MPSFLPEHCPDLRNRYVKAWVYGYTQTTDAEYFVISGLVHSHNEETGREMASVHPDIDGLIVAVSVKDSRCALKAEDSFYWTADEKDPLWNLPESALALDALHRYAKAFGGKVIFLKSLKHRERLAPVMRKELDIFEKQPGI
jgi:hypothetical protein